MARLSGLRSRLAFGGLVAVAGIAAVILLTGGDEADGGKSGGWRSLTQSPLSRTEVGAARVGQFIYVLGGFQPPDGKTSDQVARYDIRHRTWSLVAPLPVAVNHPAVAVHRGHLYVYGGFNEQGETDALQRFDPSTGGWTTLAGSGRARGAATLAAVRKTLYAIGGASGASPLDLVQVYDIRKGTWRSGPTMRVAREHIASAVLGDRILVLGGRVPGRNLATVEALNTGKHRWSKLPPLRTARSGFQAVSVKDRAIVAVGGETIGIEPAHTIACVELFDPRRRRWLALTHMPTPRHGLGVVSQGRRVFAIEGGPQPGLAYSSAVEQLRVPKQLLGPQP